LRSPSFLSTKLARGVAEIKLGRQKELIIGNLDAMVDWGYAPDYTSAMTLMLEQEIPNDFIVATGIAHSVRQFAEVAFGSVGLDFKNYIKTNPSLIQRDHGILVGDPSRLKSATGWNATISFDAMVHQLVREQLNAVEQTLFS
jgi:GDPmannose 4,6-dehydratase